MLKNALLGAICCLLLGPLTARAGTISLTTTSSSGSAAGAVGGTFQVFQAGANPLGAGTGFIDSFLRVQNNGGEQGYNTSGGTPFDDKGGGFTRALALGEVPIVNIGGTNYRQFVLDINQEKSNPLLTLNQIQIFQSTSDRTDGSVDSSGTFPQISFGSGATQVFEMSAQNTGNQSQIVLDFSLEPGSGTIDMFLYVPDADFSSSLGNNVILYSQFGDYGSLSTNTGNDGFEEWAVLKGSASQVLSPEPGSMALAAAGVVTALGYVWKRRKRPVAA
jgi:hypothetical protein